MANHARWTQAWQKGCTQLQCTHTSGAGKMNSTTSPLSPVVVRAHLVRLMIKIDTVQQFLLNEQLIAVAKGAQNCPHCLCARLFNEEGVQEQEALQSQTVLIQALQKRPC